MICIIVGTLLAFALAASRYRRADQPGRADFSHRNRHVRDLRGVTLNGRFGQKGAVR
jgi:hypothetical protein